MPTQDPYLLALYYNYKFALGSNPDLMQTSYLFALAHNFPPINKCWDHPDPYAACYDYTYEEVHEAASWLEDVLVAGTWDLGAVYNLWITNEGFPQNSTVPTLFYERGFLEVLVTYLLADAPAPAEYWEPSFRPSFSKDRLLSIDRDLLAERLCNPR